MLFQNICNVLTHHCRSNLVGGVMVSMLALSAVDCGFQAQSGKTKEYKIGICCFSTKHAVVRRKKRDWLALKHVYTRTVVSVSWHYKNLTKRLGLVQSGPHHHHHLIENYFVLAMI